MRRGFFNETGFQASLLQDKVINKTCKKVGVSGGKWIKITYFSILNTKRFMATFIGDYACKVYVKGRIIVPMAFKKKLPADALDHFVVRKDIFENCLILYSIEDWDRQLEKIRKRINPYNREHNVFLRNFFKGTAELTLDNNNRILIPRRLLDLIGADRDVVLAGQDGRIEIWAADIYEKVDMAPDDFANLAEKLMGGTNNEPEE
jgi:MraZ protein